MSSSFDFEWINLDVVLPIGISFYTFQQIAYLIDTYQGKTTRVSLSYYFFFVSFFPQLIAGPIVHHSEIFSQLNNHKKHVENFSIGLSIFCLGLFKKLFIADSLAPIATSVFDYAAIGGQPTLVESWLGTLSYSFQIYFDFSAYSDMAVGLARFFGFRLPQNFSSPYKSKSITEFWRRWHITLSRFLRDYLYIPLGGNRKGYVDQKVNVFITMLLGGIWHGAGWTFLVWGALHGVYLIVNHSLSNTLIFKRSPKLPISVSWLLTMFFVFIAWVPFRAESLDATLLMWRSMFFLNNLELTGSISNVVSFRTFGLLLLCFFICIFMPNVNEMFRSYRGSLSTKGYETTLYKSKSIKWRPNLFWGSAVLIMFWLCALKLNDPSEFLYFQF